ncbi:apolipoprotein N-acyltransferase [Actinoallomurus oryzae]|uniref:Apolipoprotein N-acyltransferase n=1 Tax=Actinoallomurus oryzae TaxID=502180 RepID=A0ABP8R670_9ACTN
MVSKSRSVVAVAGVTVASALLFHFGTGLRPVPWLTWLAPFPVLMLAPRVRARTAFGAAAVAWLGGETAMWGYFLGTVRIPPPMVVLIIVGSALLFGLVVLPTRALLLRGRPLLAAAAFPAGWVTVEYTVSLTAPNGAWWSLAYSQAGVLPVLQTVSITGVWGVTFLVMGAPAAVAALFAPDAKGRLRVAVAAATVLVLALGYGGWRLRSPDGRQTERAALVSTDRTIDPVSVDTPAGRDLLDAYTARIRSLTAPHIRVVVLPEKVFMADDASLPALTGPLSRLAVERHADIIAGLVLRRGGALYNVAVDLPPDGGRPVTYVKRHLVPGAESALTPGDGTAFVPGTGTRWAIAICFDLDFPGLVRDYRRSGATALFAPAWDFTDDAWLHSRMAVTRGVENGMTLVRASRQGALTVSDPHGRVRAEARTSGASIVSVTADLPTRAVATLYTRLGDWFAWGCALLFVAAAALSYLARAGRTGSGETHRTGARRPDVRPNAPV